MTATISIGNMAAQISEADCEYAAAYLKRLAEKMHPNEEAIVRAFIAPPRRPRWLQSLGSAKKRWEILDHLNHCRDLDERYASAVPSNADIIELLTSHGAPKSCYVVSDNKDIDGKELNLSDAVARTELGGWGTIIGCIPGQLAYYYDECGERRMILERD